MSAQSIPAKIRVETGYVSPSDLEVSWETDDRGGVYTWVQVKHGAEVEFRSVHEETVESYDMGLDKARGMVAEFGRRISSGMIPVARVNVSEQGGGMSFLATVMEPAREMKF